MNNDTGLMLTSNSMPVMEIALMIERRKLMGELRQRSPDRWH